MSIKHPNKWLCVHPGDYLKEMMGDRTELGNIFYDLLEASLTMSEPKYVGNKISIDRSHAMWEDWLNKKMSWKQKGAEKFKAVKAELKALKGDTAPEGGLFANQPKSSYPPSKEDVLEFAKSIGAEHAEAFYDWTSSNDWKDSFGKSLRDWRRAMIAYEKKHNPEFKPPTANNGTTTGEER